jgi:hypothetical protein
MRLIFIFGPELREQKNRATDHPTHFLSQTFLFLFFLRINTFPKCSRTCILIKNVKSYDSLNNFYVSFLAKKRGKFKYFLLKNKK